MCSHAQHGWDHSCECGLISNTEVCATATENEYRLRQHGACFELIYACICTRSMSSSLLTTACREKQTEFVEEFGDHLQ